MRKRVISAVALLVILFSFVLLSRITRVIIFGLIGALCIYEFCSNFEKQDIHCTQYLLFAYMAVSALLIILRAGDRSIFICLAAFAYLILISAVINHHVGARGAIYSLCALMYPGFLFTIIMVVINTQYWLQIVCLGCIPCWVCDCFALFGGMRFGKHKLAPRISPNKTVEGSVCGALAATVSGALLYWLIPLLKYLSPVVFACADTDIPLLLFIVTAFIASSLGQLGDLAESMVKRHLGIKDFSNLIPGHGGMFDRVDSLLFAIPTAYFCLVIGRIL